jgi:hypothetical protein
MIHLSLITMPIALNVFLIGNKAFLLRLRLRLRLRLHHHLFLLTHDRVCQVH